MSDILKTLDLLKIYGAEGIHSFHLGNMIGTIRVAARVNDLRRAGYIITSTPETLGNARGVRYRLIEKGDDMKSNEELQKEIETLREQWKTAVGVDRKIIEIRGKALKVTLEGRFKKQQKFL